MTEMTDQKIKEDIRECFKKTFKLQTRIGPGFQLAFKALVMQTVKEQSIDEAQFTAVRNDVSYGIRKLLNDKQFDNQKVIHVKEELEYFEQCAPQLRKYILEHSWAQSYVQNLNFGEIIEEVYKY